MIQDWLGPVAGIVGGAHFLWESWRFYRRGQAGWTVVFGSVFSCGMMTTLGFQMRGDLAGSILLGGFSAAMALVPIRTWVRLIAGKKGLDLFDREMSDSLQKTLDRTLASGEVPDDADELRAHRKDT